MSATKSKSQPANIEELKAHLGSWSKVFRQLHAEGYTNGQISKMTGKRYQHVRNVLITPLTGK